MCRPPGTHVPTSPSSFLISRWTPPYPFVASPSCKDWTSLVSDKEKQRKRQLPSQKCTEDLTYWSGMRRETALSNTGSRPKATGTACPRMGLSPQGQRCSGDRVPGPLTVLELWIKPCCGLFNSLCQFSLIIYTSVGLLDFLITFCISNC